MSCERALFYRQICEQCRAGQVWQNTSEVKEVRGRRHRSVKWNRSAAPPLFPPPPATSWFFLHSKRACQRHWSLLLVSAPSCCLLSLFAIGVAAFLLHAWRYRSSYSRVLFIPSAFDVIWQSLALVFPSSGGGPIFFFFPPSSPAHNGQGGASLCVQKLPGLSVPLLVSEYLFVRPIVALT